MIFDVQRASMWKRISAYLFDFIILGIVVVGVAFIMSVITGYDGYGDRFDDIRVKYETEYGIEFEISQEAFNELSDEQKSNYDAAFEALSKDNEASYVYTMMVNLTLVITSISILFGYVILELIVPLIFKNGQTLGKKIFGIALMRTDGVRTTPFALFVRTILGKYTIETMVPVLIIVMIYFNVLGLTGTVILGLIALLQIIMVAATRSRSAIHDLLACTVVVDYSSQRIFDSSEELLEYKKKLHEERAASRER